MALLLDHTTSIVGSPDRKVIYPREFKKPQQSDYPEHWQHLYQYREILGASLRPVKPTNPYKGFRSEAPSSQLNNHRAFNDNIMTRTLSKAQRRDGDRKNRANDAIDMFGWDDFTEDELNKMDGQLEQ